MCGHQAAKEAVMHRHCSLPLVTLLVACGASPERASSSPDSPRGKGTAARASSTATAAGAASSSGASRSAGLPLLPPLPPATSTPAVSRPARQAPSLPATRARLAAQPVSGFVLLTKEAKAYASAEQARASQASPAGKLAIDTSGGRNRCGAMVTYRVRRDLGDLVEVESLTPKQSQPHCYGGVHRDWDDVQIHAVVRKRDLLPVLRTTSEVSFDDGTGVSLAPGLPVGEPALPLHGGWGVCSRALSFELPIAPSEIGLSYQPKRFATSSRGDALQDEDLLYLRSTAWLRADDLPSSLQDVKRERQQDGQVLLELGGSCVKLWVTTPERAQPPDLGGGGGGVAGMGRLGGGRKPKYKMVKRYYLREGVAVHWESGLAAGRTLSSRMMPGPGKRVGNRQCYRFHVGVDEMLCLGPGGIETKMEKVRRW